MRSYQAEALRLRSTCHAAVRLEGDEQALGYLRQASVRQLFDGACEEQGSLPRPCGCLPALESGACLMRFLRFLPFFRPAARRTGILPMDRNEARYLERRRSERTHPKKERD